MQYKIKTVAEEGWHFHPELEFIFVIEGQIRLEMQGRNDLLKKHDVVLINPDTQHAIYVQEKAIVCVVNYSWRCFRPCWAEKRAYLPETAPPNINALT